MINDFSVYIPNHIDYRYLMCRLEVCLKVNIHSATKLINIFPMQILPPKYNFLPGWAIL